VTCCTEKFTAIRNLLDHGLPEEIAATLQRHDPPAELLELEITESVVVEDPERALSTLRELTPMGIRLAIDDFERATPRARWPPSGSARPSSARAPAAEAAAR
jgi:hypothetical protein